MSAAAPPDRRAPAVSWAWRLILIALAAAAAFKIVTLNLGDHALRTGNPVLIEAMAPHSAHAAAGAAELRLAAGDVQAAERLARQAIQGVPFSQAAHRTL